jgi:WD40-like Beta Propeller Repeat
VNTMEDQLRDAYAAAAETVRPNSIRGLPDQAARRARPAFRPSPARSRRARVLVPLAAATAVAAIAVTASLVLPASQPGHGGAATPGALPRFFLAMPNNPTGDQMAVFSATTGRQLALIKAPPGSVIDTAAATGNDRTFVVTVESSGRCGMTTLYRLRLTARGGQGSLAPLAIPKISGVVTALAASADGRTIAYATAFCGGGNSDSPGAIGVVHTAAGQSRQWSWLPDPGQTIGSVSITANGRTIEYAASPNKVTSPTSGQTLPPRTIRLLPTDAPPGNAAQRSRAAVTMSRVAPGEIFNSAAIAPDGRTLYFCTQRNASQPSGGALVLHGYDIATGVTSVLRNFRPGGCLLGASGNDLLVGHGLGLQGHAQRLARYDAATGKSTPVPVPRPWDEVPASIPW